MAKVLAYARCSTDESRQDINRQKRELKKLGVKDDKHIYWEYESGAKTDRAEFNKLLDNLNPGDTIGSFIVDCRNDEIDPMTKGMLMMWGVFSEMERDIFSQRVKFGMDNARAKGRKIGRPRVVKDSLPEKFFKFYDLYKDGQFNITEFAKLMNCYRTTIYKYIRMVQ